MGLLSGKQGCRVILAVADSQAIKKWLIRAKWVIKMFKNSPYWGINHKAGLKGKRIRRQSVIFACSN